MTDETAETVAMLLMSNAVNVRDLRRKVAEIERHLVEMAAMQRELQREVILLLRPERKD